MSTQNQIVAQVANGVKSVKKGVTTTEFYLSSFVVALGTVVQFLPASEATGAVKLIGLISGALSAVGYTASRTLVKKT